MRSVVDEVFLYIPMDDEFPIAMTVQNLEDMGIKTNLNISQFQINENLERSLEKVGPYESVSFSGHNVSFVMLMMKRAMDITGGVGWNADHSDCSDHCWTAGEVRITGAAILLTEESWEEWKGFSRSIRSVRCIRMRKSARKSLWHRMRWTD